ncbi:transmembrane protein 223 isoform X2 [Rhodnius prolixus]|uniref:Uncharacterized protein n=1 Tax=Rhodnius prolixus TaxID=13249 RepID=T1HD35_RHOPR
MRWVLTNLLDLEIAPVATLIYFILQFAGYLMLAGSWFYTLKSVRYLVLRKGGNAVSFVTYTPYGQNRIMDVPLNKVSAAESRHNAKVHLPIKVQGKYLHYMLDMKGEFTNKQLFDATAGLRRKFS